MNGTRKINYQMFERLRGTLEPSMCEEVIVKYLSLGYYDSKKMYVNLDKALGSTDIKLSCENLFAKIEDEVPTLKNVFKYLNGDKVLSNQMIYNLISLIRTANLKPTDYSVSFENVLEISSSMKNSLFSQTPPCLNKLGIGLLGNIEGSFYDGTSGLNGTLIEAWKTASHQGNSVSLFGQEIHSKTWAIGQLRMYMHGIEDAKIELGNTISEPKFTDNKNELMKFDRIMMSPPLGYNWKIESSVVEHDPYNRFVYGKPSLNSAEPLFLAQLIKSLKVNGKGIALVGSGMLFRMASDAVVRTNMIMSDYIETVIGLPSGLLNPYTGIAVNMIVINLNKDESMKGKIQFINAENLFESVRKNQRVLTEVQINQIVEIYENKLEVEELSVIVNRHQLEDNILLPSRYVSKAEFESEEFGTVKVNTKSLNLLKDTQTLGSISEFYRGINVVVRDIVEDEKGAYRIINMGDVKDGEISMDSLTRYSIKNNARIESYVVKEGDIIISSKGTINKITIVPKHEGTILLSQNFIGIRIKCHSPEYVKAFLQSPLGQYLIDSRKVGTSLVTLNPKDLKDIPIILPPLEKQENIIATHTKQEDMIRSEIKQLQYKLKNLKLQMYEEMKIIDTFKLL